MNWPLIMVVMLICGAIAAGIGHAKNVNTAESFVLGAILGVLGIILVLWEKPRLPRAPIGMRAVKCPRCGTVQNIPSSDTGYECWQCHNSVFSTRTILDDTPKG